MINKKENELQNESGILGKFLKTIIYTIIIALGVSVLDYSISGKKYVDGVLQRELNNSLIFSMGVGVIFTIIFCTFTILEVLKEKN